jgi:hypothetical protein
VEVIVPGQRKIVSIWIIEEKNTMAMEGYNIYTST